MDNSNITRRVGRPKSPGEPGVRHNIYFPHALYKYFTKSAKLKGLSINKAVLGAINKVVHTYPEPISDRNFGEYQLD